MKHLKHVLIWLLILSFALGSLTSCEYLEELGIKLPFPVPGPNNEPTEDPETKDPTKAEEWAEQYDCITIAEALKMCEEFVQSPSTDRYYIIATVKSVDNTMFGQLTVEDETGSIMVYGTNSADGSLKYDQAGILLAPGDVILIYGTLQHYKGETKEIQNAWLIDYYTPETEAPNVDDYTEATIAEARLASDGALVKVSGIVARITYSTGIKPSGFYLIDSTGSIYVYDAAIASSVAIGNKITVAGAKDHWILETEKSNADKFGYKGCNQITNATLVDNDKGNHDFDKSWITETTVKAIIDTPVTEDITTNIYKVTALVKKVPGSGFVNYYIDDLDGVTGTYTYTQCNGDDFAWLDEFDGKICTVYLSALNAKSTATGCNWRFIPVAVIDEGFEFNLNDTPKFAVKYYGVPALESSYMVDAKVELPTAVDSTILGFSGASIKYAVSDSTVASIEYEDGKLYLYTLKDGTFTVTVTGEYAGAPDYSETVTITVSTPVDYDYISVKDAIDADNNTEVTVKGIVGPSAVNQAGTFYLIDDSGAIAVKGYSADEIMSGLSIGDEVIVKGKRTITKDGGGQIVISDAEILTNYYGNHDYSTESFMTGKSISDIKAVSDTPEATTQVYVVTAKVEKVSKQQGSYTNVTFYVGGDSGVLLYSGSAAQYSWLEDFFKSGESSATLTVELALCDWNAKGLKGCVLAVYNDDGTKTYNTLNFSK